MGKQCKQWPLIHSFSVFFQLWCAAIQTSDMILTACQTESRCVRMPRRQRGTATVVSWHCCCHWHRHCVNGFPDSPVCISVSQLSCEDFLTLIAPLCCVHIAWHRGCWVKHVEQRCGEQHTKGTVRKRWRNYSQTDTGLWSLNIRGGIAKMCVVFTETIFELRATKWSSFIQM